MEYEALAADGIPASGEVAARSADGGGGETCTPPPPPSRFARRSPSPVPGRIKPDRPLLILAPGTGRCVIAELHHPIFLIDMDNARLERRASASSSSA